MVNRILGSSLLVAAAVIGSVGCGKTRRDSSSANDAGTSPLDSRDGSAGATGSGTGGTGIASSGAPSASGAGGGPLSCPGAPVTCLDSKTVQFCDSDGTRRTVVCQEGMAVEGFASSGCDSTTPNGCTVDGFLDPDCQAGTPAFTACVGGNVDDLLDVYAACFVDLNGAQSVIGCYRDYLDETKPAVDCAAAQVACSTP